MPCRPSSKKCAIPCSRTHVRTLLSIDAAAMSFAGTRWSSTTTIRAGPGREERRGVEAGARPRAGGARGEEGVGGRGAPPRRGGATSEGGWRPRRATAPPGRDERRGLATEARHRSAGARRAKGVGDRGAPPLRRGATSEGGWRPRRATAPPGRDERRGLATEARHRSAGARRAKGVGDRGAPPLRRGATSEGGWRPRRATAPPGRDERRGLATEARHRSAGARRAKGVGDRGAPPLRRGATSEGGWRPRRATAPPGRDERRGLATEARHRSAGARRAKGVGDRGAPPLRRGATSEGGWRPRRATAPPGRDERRGLATEARHRSAGARRAKGVGDRGAPPLRRGATSAGGWRPGRAPAPPGRDQRR